MVTCPRTTPASDLDFEVADYPGDPCLMVTFGASGDLMGRLLVPALYNLACDRLLGEDFVLLGAALDDFDTPRFRERMSGLIRKFHTRDEFDEAVWEDLVSRFHYVSGDFRHAGLFRELKAEAEKLELRYDTRGNRLFYLATAPAFFGPISADLHASGFREGPGWRRIVVEKPYGTDLESAVRLNAEILAHWDEQHVYRVDHYLGKETVQNLLAFRFANGIFEPLWNRHHISNVQLNVSEAVDVEGRGAYYDRSGVLRDMIQNHMFQMLAYLCMEPPDSLETDAIRNEKAKLLKSIRVYTPAEVARYAVRGQYGPLLDASGSVLERGYREGPGVSPGSKTETYAAAQLHIDNERWEGVPFFLRSGKALWKRGTEIVIEFRRAGEGIPGAFRDQGPNRLIFHIQPRQSIQMLFYAKTPGLRLQLQPVHMSFGYEDAFRACRYTGYEIMIHSCTRGDPTLFSRGDLIETSWRIVQPIIDYWSETQAPEFPNYERGSWGPTAAADLIEREGVQWHEVVTEEQLRKVPLFRDADGLFLSQLLLALRPRQAAAGEIIIMKGDIGREMYLLVRGDSDVVDDERCIYTSLRNGDFFGEVSLLLSTPRSATVRAKTDCDLLVLDRTDFHRILRDHPRLAEQMAQVARERYTLNLCTENATGNVFI